MAETVRVVPGDPTTAAARRLIAQSDAYASELYPVESNYLLSVEALQAPGVRFFVAALGGEVIGCGALKRLAPEAAEVKRMWVDLAHRGKGYGGAILAELERAALEEGIQVLRLETGILQPAAIRLYERHGFRRTPPFGDYPDDPLCVFYAKWLNSHPAP